MKPKENIKLKFQCKQYLNSIKEEYLGFYFKDCQKNENNLRTKDSSYINKYLQNQGFVCGIFNQSQVQTNKHLNYYRRLLKSVLLILGLSFFNNGISAQVYSSDSLITIQKNDQDKLLVCGPVDGIPVFKYGGEEGLRAFLLNHMKHPGDSTKGKVIVEFAVDSLGKPKEIKIVKSLNKLADDEVLRVVSLLEFECSSNDKKLFPVKMILPFKFDY